MSSVNGVGVVRGHTVVGEQGVQKRTKHTPLWDSCVKGQRSVGDVAYPHHLGLPPSGEGWAHHLRYADP